MTWFLHGGNIGGIASPYAQTLYSYGFSLFVAQFTTDILIDIPDKMITVGIVFAILCFGPENFYQHFPMGYIYRKTGENDEKSISDFTKYTDESDWIESGTGDGTESGNQSIRKSVNQKIVSVVMTAVAFISIMAVTIGTIYHHERLLRVWRTYTSMNMDMCFYVHDLMIYIIQVVTVLFALSLLLAALVLWYINKYVTMPIRKIVSQTKALDQISPEKWLESSIWKNRVLVETGDELEELYNTVYKAQENTSKNVQRLIETERQLLQTEELKRVNEELEKAMRKADEANRAKTDFLSRMSHDIRTPLNAILGTAALAKEEITDQEAMKEALETIDSSGHFLLGLINEILDINKIESGNIDLRTEEYFITEFVAMVISAFQPLMDRKQLDFQFRQDLTCKAVVTDKLRFNQIFFNLLSNAVKYTKAGGTITFLLEQMSSENGCVKLCCTVRDTGIGMSEEYRKHLFEPFTRDSSAEINQTEGSGLGLAIVKNIVDAMGGSIRVHSTLDEGSEFIVELCLQEAKSVQGWVKEVNRVDDALLYRCKVLLVEDNEINIRIARKMLELKGCIVSIARNGQEALEQFETSEINSFDCILMDIRMPVMNGLEAATRIRQLQRPDALNVPIVAMTADAFSKDIEDTRRVGMNAHLTKPVDTESLYTTLAKMLQLKGES
ncbi:MAG: ATP-binding protein [Lachnospiraceae bacterium]|nr:ATP-binding protein [Lachnospiraceae bacterium]